MQHYHVAVVRQLDLRELACGLLNESRVGAGRRRQHDVECLASLAYLGDARSTEAPLIDDRVQRLLALSHDAAVVLDSAVLQCEAGQRRRAGQLAPVGRVEEAVAPLHEDTINGVDHGLLLSASPRNADARSR